MTGEGRTATTRPLPPYPAPSDRVGTISSATLRVRPAITRDGLWQFWLCRARIRKAMSLTEPSARRLKPVRLTDIPLERRYAAAVREAKHATPDEAEALLAAALNPSRTVYFVTLDAAAA